MLDKTAATDHPIHELLARRWSPHAFQDRPVPATDLRSLFEAARWAASSYNEQPWSYIVATKDKPEEFNRLLSCLVEGNQVVGNLVQRLSPGKIVEFAQGIGKTAQAADGDPPGLDGGGVGLVVRVRL